MQLFGCSRPVGELNLQTDGPERLIHTSRSVTRDKGGITRSGRHGRRGWALFFFSYLLLVGPPEDLSRAADAPPFPWRILVIYSDHRLLPANTLFDECLRKSLASRAEQRIECYGEFLDEVRFPTGYEKRMRDLLLEKYVDRPVDVIVAFTSSSLDFCVRNRSELFPGIPIVFTGIERRAPLAHELDPGITGVRSSFDGPATLRLAVRLHPKTRRVYLITGSGGVEPSGIPGELAGLEGSEPHLSFHHLTEEPLASLLQELARLPENSLVVDLSGIHGSADQATSPHEAMRRMSEASPAPIYGVFDPLVGSGLVGAITTPMDEVGRETAELILAVLSRSDTNRLPAVRNLPAVPVVDWRQLRRWGLRKSQLPPGTILRFEAPSFWRQHLALVVTTTALILLQSGLILSLVLQSRRRQRAELEARRRREELGHMTRVATMGELTASLAHEINQPLAAILSNAQAAQRLLSHGDDHREEIGEILADIVDDDRRAGEVIRRMRNLLRKGESSPTTLDLNDLVGEVVGLVHGEMILQNVSLSLELHPEHPAIHGDRVQLQQVLLNLVVNALDAMKETPGGDRKVIIRTGYDQGGRSVKISVSDNGIGIPSAKLDEIFQPFYTTKSHGLGLGLPICRSIIQAHGGRIGSRNNSDRGATFWITLPSAEEAQL